MSSVCVVPIYFEGREALVAGLCECIRRTLPVSVRVRTPWFEPHLAFDEQRRQYSANTLLRQLLTDPEGDHSKVLGVIGRDLFAPALTYVFGEGQFNGRAAIVSIERLRTDAYGLPPDEALLDERLRKEALHELGHTYGMVHCRDAACVMHPSTWAEQIDFKSARFCPQCRRALSARFT